jgi:DNA-binding CsgD family transcriptional regulator
MINLVLGSSAGNDVFVGRKSACELLDAFVASVSCGGAAGVLTGEAGIGKTALLHRLARYSEVPVRWLRGMEAETVLPFAVAADLLVPLRAYFPAVPASQRRALEVALALADGPPPSTLAVCAGALGVLAAAGDDGPLLIFVDDLQWIDAESRQLLLFAARRLTTERVGVLFALREDASQVSVVHDLPVLRLRGLTLAECEELARRRNLQARSQELSELVRATGGNPLAVIETLARRNALPVTPKAAAGVAVGGQVQRVWQKVLRAMPEQTRHALYVLAVARPHGLPALPALLQALGLSLQDLVPAEQLDLITLDRDQVELRHPLLGQVLIDATPLAVRIPTCRALAELAVPEQRPWYLSLAAVGPDDDVAAELLAAAQQARARGARISAAQLARRSAELSVTAADRADRLLAGATDSLLAGQAAQAERWCEEALSLRADAAFSAAVTGLRCRALMWMGETRLAADELLRAAEVVQRDDEAMAARLLNEAVMPIAMSGDVQRCFEAAVQSEALVPGEFASFHGRVMTAAAYLLHGDIKQGRHRLELADLLRPDADPESEQHAFTIMAEVYWWLEDFDQAKRLITSVIELLRQRGASAAFAFALTIRSDIGFRTGRWSSAYADAAEALQWAEEMQQLSMIGYSLLAMARIEAARGQRGLCEEHVDLSLRRTGSSGTDSLLVYQAAALGLSAMTHGEPNVAVEHLENAWQLATGRGLGHPGVVPFLADLIEAHIRRGDMRRAEQLLASLEERGDTMSLVYAAAAAHRCRGLLSRGTDEALSEFSAARTAHARCVMPFELARTLLCQGEALRRARHLLEARKVLREAHRIFEGLGARPWADRAARELAASGARRRTPVQAVLTDLDALTPQELQIARAVAGGKNNCEVSAALFVSRKTVEAHLTRIYRKLGIRSRVELTRALLAAGVADLPLPGRSEGSAPAVRYVLDGDRCPGP